MQTISERERVAHLLRRFGLGASEAELGYYGNGGSKAAVDKLLNYKDNPWRWDVPPSAFANNQGVVNIRVMQGMWYLRVLATQKPLEEKMTIFWHHHFAVSGEKVDNSFALMNYVETLRTHATGKFKDLLRAVSKDPSMIFWLDNQENVKGKPNENFAREIMELFTMGIGHYTETDVLEAARAFTGWAYGVPVRNGRSLTTNNSPRRVDRFVFVPERHDYGAKKLLGKSGDLNGDDVIDLLCGQPETARFLVKKIWEWFVYADPDTKVIDKFAKIFRDSDLDIAVLLRAIMLSEEFYSDKATRTLIKNPIDFCVSTARQLGIGEAAMTRVRSAIANPQINEQNGLNQALIRAAGPAFLILQSTKSMGMELMYPPDVSGWRTGSYWVTSATMVERIKWADMLFGTAVAGARPGGNAAAAPLAQGGNPGGYMAMTLFRGDPSPKGVVDKLTSIFDVQLPDATVQTLVASAQAESSGRLTLANSAQTAAGVCKLMFGSPEFQFE
ncbi:MAG: DUF1800 domain-containing protein [Fimbriimonadaceae bacterium]|nr:DUF1800 domain-containing protein [Fimbriimonadaceae bacterium]